MADDVTGAVTGMIPTVLAIGLLKKTSEMTFGKAKAKPFPKLFKK
jgi:hypothetical protein